MDDIYYEPIEEREAPDHEKKLVAEILRVAREQGSERVEIHVGDVVRIILNNVRVGVIE